MCHDNKNREDTCQHAVSSDVQRGNDYNYNRRMRDDEGRGRWHDTIIEIVTVAEAKHT